MKIVRWQFNNLHVPMIQDDENNLFCTTRQLADALQTKEESIRQLAKTHQDELCGICVIANHANFFKDNKVELGIKYIRKDMRFWSVDEMIAIAMLTKSDPSRAFRKDIIELVKKNATTGYVKKDEYDKMVMELGKLAVKVSSLEKMLNPDKSVKLRLVQ